MLIYILFSLPILIIAIIVNVKKYKKYKNHQQNCDNKVVSNFMNNALIDLAITVILISGTVFLVIPYCRGYVTMKHENITVKNAEIAVNIFIGLTVTLITFAFFTFITDYLLYKKLNRIRASLYPFKKLLPLECPTCKKITANDAKFCHLCGNKINIPDN
ncbi:MAG: zinc ribbon domain-containing protein [Ruminococcaceae bacterium]|nr:zinc ribbon domain-containing protein [Oscillospiraceae bacterium]